MTPDSLTLSRPDILWMLTLLLVFVPLAGEAWLRMAAVVERHQRAPYQARVASLENTRRLPLLKLEAGDFTAAIEHLTQSNDLDPDPFRELLLAL